MRFGAGLLKSLSFHSLHPQKGQSTACLWRGGFEESRVKGPPGAVGCAGAGAAEPALPPHLPRLGCFLSHQPLAAVSPLPLHWGWGVGESQGPPLVSLSHTGSPFLCCSSPPSSPLPCVWGIPASACSDSCPLGVPPSQSHPWLPSSPASGGRWVSSDLPLWASLSLPHGCLSPASDSPPPP